MRRNRQHGWGLGAALVMLLVPAATAWGYYFDDRREMSLSGFAYTRATFATTSDNIGTNKGFYQAGNLVQHRNFLTLEWRHNLNRLSREFPQAGTAFQFLNLDAFDYYLNFREEYDGAWDYGTNKQRRQLHGGGGTTFWDKYFGRQREKYPGEFTRFVNFEYINSIKLMEKQVNRTRLFEWYFNITKGPLFLRIGKQNLSWGETDGFRLLDQINPLDNAFGGFLLPLDERRVPLPMLRAQWSFGTVGPIADLTLEGFVSPSRITAAPFIVNQGEFLATVPTNTSPVTTYKAPCGGPIFGARSQGPTLGLKLDRGRGVPCSVRAQGPHNALRDSRGGGRLIGTIHDFTFSLAHYYTWSDVINSEAAVGSPTPEHLAWDLGAGTFTALTGKPATLANNPWGPNDPAVGLGNVKGGPGAFLAGTPAAVERNLAVLLRAKRIQVSGASLSFPVNALTSLFVGSDNPLYYIYTTFRSEVAYFRNIGFRTDFHDGQAGPALQRFLSVPLTNAGVTTSPFLNKEFLPGGHFSSEGTCLREDGLGVRGCRRGRMKSADTWAFNIGLDHNQWIRWLNPVNSFTFSAQLFKVHVMNMSNTFRTDRPAGLLNDRFAIGVRPRSAAPTGPTTNPKLLSRPGGVGNRTQGCITRLVDPSDPSKGRQPNPPCVFKGLVGLPQDQELFTLSINTQYLAGNLRPSVTFFYDWSGSYLFQPGIDWTFYDPFRLSIRYNLIDGNYGGIGLFKTKDNVWVELQYLLY